MSRAEHRVRFRLRSDLLNLSAPGFPVMYYTIIRGIKRIIREYALRFFISKNISQFINYPRREHSLIFLIYIAPEILDMGQGISAIAGHGKDR